MVDRRLGRSGPLKRLESEGRGKGMYIKCEMWDSKWKDGGADGTAEARSVEWSPWGLARAGWFSVTPVNSCLEFTRHFFFL